MENTWKSTIARDSPHVLMKTFYADNQIRFPLLRGTVDILNAPVSYASGIRRDLVRLARNTFAYESPIYSFRTFHRVENVFGLYTLYSIPGFRLPADPFSRLRRRFLS